MLFLELFFGNVEFFIIVCKTIFIDICKAKIQYPHLIYYIETGVDKIDPNLVLIIIAAIFAVLNILSFYLGVVYRKKVAEAKLGSAEEEAKSIIENAQKSAHQKYPEQIVE